MRVGVIEDTDEESAISSHAYHSCRAGRGTYRHLRAHTAGRWIVIALFILVSLILFLGIALALLIMGTVGSSSRYR
jgi:hypothetical protein